MNGRLSAHEWAAKGIETVTFLFAAFGGFLTDIAPPPEAGSKFAVGVSSILTLCVLLFVWASLKSFPAMPMRRIFFIAAGVCFVIAVGSAIWYQSKYNELTYGYPPDRPSAIGLAGTEMTPKAQAEKQANELKTNAELVADFGGTPSRVWTPASMRSAATILTVMYIIVVLSIAGTIFGITEGILTA